MSKTLIEHLQKNHGLAANADVNAARTLGRSLVKGGTLTLDQYRDLCADRAFSSPDGKSLSSPTAAQTAGAIDRNISDRRFDRQPDSAVQPAHLFGGSDDKGFSHAGRVDVVKASDGYDSTNARKMYPRKGTKGAKWDHEKAGDDVTFEGRAAYDLSQRQKAQMGAWIRWRTQKMLKTPLMRDHEWQLLRELMDEAEWVGDTFNPATGKSEYVGEPRKLTGWEVKTMLEDSTSGGTNLVPYFYDVEIVLFPLLYGQLAPYVDTVDLPVSNQVKVPTFQNLTINEGPAEGDSPGITLQTTAALAGINTVNVFNATGAITAGRFLLEDSPIRLQETWTALYQKALLNFLDSEIACGAGTNFITGLLNTSSPGTYTATNATAGPVTVADVQDMISTMPVQYRMPTDRAKLAWIMRDSLYWHIRNIPVGVTSGTVTDQRLIYGYNWGAYELEDVRVAVVDGYNTAATLPASTLMLARLDMYRLWRRKGATFEVSTEGKTLMLANELLLTIRARYAGACLWPSSLVIGSNFSLHKW
ncbi:MAG: phage major capsid protein [Patescibacteria group bacterium]|nr:phage major capsid protein [Patescibacteria group bacterium]